MLALGPVERLAGRVHAGGDATGLRAWSRSTSSTRAASSATVGVVRLRRPSGPSARAASRAAASDSRPTASSRSAAAWRRRRGCTPRTRAPPPHGPRGRRPRGPARGARASRRPRTARRHEAGRQLRGDAPQPALLQVEPALLGGVGTLAGRPQPVRCAPRCRPRAGPARAPHAACDGPGRACPRGARPGWPPPGRRDALLVVVAERLPAGEPGRRVLQGVVVGARLPVQIRALAADLLAGAARPCGRPRGRPGPDAASAPGRTVAPRPPPLRSGMQLGTGAVACTGRGAVLPLGVVAQSQRGGDAPPPCGRAPAGSAAPRVPGVAPPARRGAAVRPSYRCCSRSSSRSASRARRAAACLLSAADRPQSAMSCRSRAPARATAAHSSTASARPGSPGCCCGSGQSAAATPAACSILWATASKSLVPRPDLSLRGASLFGEPVLDGGEAAGVEEPAEELAAGLGVGAQEAREVALRQQHDLAELVAAHAEELGELLADLLVGAAQRLPLACRRVVLAQPALGLARSWTPCRASWAAAARAGGDLQPPPGRRSVRAGPR